MKNTLKDEEIVAKIYSLKEELKKLKNDPGEATISSTLRPKVSYSLHLNCTHDMFELSNYSVRKSQCENCKKLLSLGLSTASCKYHQKHY